MHDEASRSTCNLTFALEKGVSKGKFDPRSVECILVGYAATSKAYRLYVPIALRSWDLYVNMGVNTAEM